MTASRRSKASGSVSFAGSLPPLESELSPAHGARLSYEEWAARLFGILARQWRVLGGRGVLATLGSARLSLSPACPCLPAGADPGLEEVN